MDRGNPYEAAFEAYLRDSGLCHVAIDETRRARLGGVPVKNLDFIVLGLTGAHLLVDVKGRQFPGGSPDKPRYVWESWSTKDDIEGLESWTRLFGSDYVALLAFVYRILPSVTLPADTPDVWRFRDETYLVRAVPLAEYHRAMKVRSPKWGTVDLPGAAFRSLARPFRWYSHECPAAAGAEEVFEYGPDQVERLAEVTALALAAHAADSASPWRAGP